MRRKGPNTMRKRISHREVLFGTLLSLAGILATTVWTPSGPREATASPTTYAVSPVADAYVSQLQPLINFGSSTKLRLDGVPIMRSYLKFDVPALVGPVSRATLRVYANSRSSVGYDIVGIPDNNWTENTASFSNAPSMAWGVVGSSGPFTGNVWTSVDVTSLVKASGPLSLAIMTTSKTQISLGSRESGATSPQLIVETFAPVLSSQAMTATAWAAVPPNETVTLLTPSPTKTSAPAPTATATATPPVVPGPALPLRAAFYYPWFSPAWTQLGIFPYTKYTPSLGYYDERDLNVIRQHIQAMEYGNISTGIASWWGQGQYTDARIPDLLSASAGTGFQWSVYYEQESQGDPSVSQLTADLTYLRDRYASGPNFLHLNGKFVVFVYADGADACAMADRWKQANTVNAYIVLKVFAGYKTCASQPDGWHQYDPAVASDSQGPLSYSISPGFDKVGEATRLGRDLTRWQQNVAAMAASGAAFQLVTTFNEWGEGTAVEGATQWGSASGYGAYLDALHNSPVGGATTPSATATRTATALTTNTPAPSSTTTSTPAPASASPTPTPTRTPTPTSVPALTGTATATRTATPPVSAGPCGTAPSAPSTYTHVIWLWMENHRYADVVGNTSAPYTSQLVHQCGAATNYAIVGSPSLPNYIGATSGSTFGIADDNPPSSHVLTGDNLFRQVRAAGMTEKSYQESMTSNCLLSNSGTYAVKHNPAAYYAGGSDRTACQADNVPMGTTASGSFLNDLNSGTLPNFSFITPNLCNDTHDCSVATGDSWLQSWVPKILASSAYQSGNTALIIMWDEYTPMPNVVITPSTPPGTLSGTAFSHYSLLRSTEEMLGITTYLGGAGAATSMRSAFGM